MLSARWRIDILTSATSTVADYLCTVLAGGNPVTVTLQHFLTHPPGERNCVESFTELRGKLGFYVLKKTHVIISLVANPTFAGGCPPPRGIGRTVRSQGVTSAVERLTGQGWNDLDRTVK
jgi:predicted small secreted protein